MHKPTIPDSETAMRLITAYIYTAGILLCVNTSVSAESIGEGRIIALDTGSATLLDTCCPTTNYECLIHTNETDYQTINARALSMREASCLIFRGDRLSVTSQLFLDRLRSHGMHCIDLAAYAAKRHPSPKWARDTDTHSRRVLEKDRFVMTLAIEQFRKIENDY